MVFILTFKHITLRLQLPFFIKSWLNDRSQFEDNLPKIRRGEVPELGYIDAFLQYKADTKWDIVWIIITN